MTIIRDHTKQLRAERDLYSKVLRQIAGRKRRTIEQRLAASVLSFWREISEMVSL